ncbi:MAG: riboflavin biosynthesis protein RibF [Flavobacteriales bacterium]|nr:MAG: riboflavin biosynthesis protein RibF [Flavobacteriales bacterium]
MKVYRGLDEFGKATNSVVTTGTFDGVHIGHRKILKSLQEVAKKEKGETVIFTFHPHPRMVLFPDDNDLRLLNTQEEKIELLDAAGIDHLIVHPFTKDFSRLTAVEYVRDVLVNQIGTKKLVIGYDHHFGRNREGNLEQLKELSQLYNFEVEEIPAQDVENVNVSSTKIRNALLKGDVKTANKYLSYDYSLLGKVAEGDKIGRTLGFPTANIELEDKHKLIPADGIYAVKVFHQEKEYNGMLSIGVRPTINDLGNRTVEVNIFDFNKEIYNEKLTINFKARIRDEKKFDSLDEMKKEIEKDKNKSLNILS